MRSSIPIVAVFFLTVLFLPFGSVSAGEERVDVVNIETYIEITIDFQEGDSLHLEADITAQPYPVSVLLIKGDGPFNDWVESETVDVEAIKNGSEPQNRTDTFEVVENFSEQNVTRFNSSIDIGDHDSYYLVIALHRESGMDIKDLIGRASEVRYDVGWEVESKELDLTLVIVAIVSFLIGLTFLVLYFISRSRAMESTNEEMMDDRKQGVHEPSGPRTRRRSPPLR